MTRMPRASASRGLPISTALAVDADLARVFTVGAAEDLHQRRLAGAVLAEQHVHVAGVQRQIDFVERQHAGERLADAAHLEHRRRPACAHGMLTSNGAPPASIDAVACSLSTDGPGTNRGSSMNTLLMWVRRTGPAGAAGLPSAGGRA